MSLDQFVGLFLFIAIAGITPGPNNIIAMTIGLNHDFKKVFPHLFGVLVGFPVMLILIGLVLKPVMERHEDIYLALKYISIAYVVYLSYRISTARVDIDTIANEKGSPLNFYQSVAFQWINPKAWAGAMTTVTVYMTPEHFHFDLMVAVVLSMLSIMISILLWAAIGRKISRFLSRPKHLKAFNIFMAVLLLVAVGMMVK